MLVRFFKNPVVSHKLFENLKSKFPSIKYFESEQGFKIPAGWLIETAGLKGYDFGTVETYKNNALVLVNKGNATTYDVLSVQQTIISTIEKLFGIKLEREPILIK
jgi:UDP-N-acetylmuramate dehydrogenase